MKKAILATKVGMTQIFNDEGVLVPVTVLQAGPCVVTQVKTVENDGYAAVQVGFVDKKEKVVNVDKNGKKEIRNRHGVNKAEKGHFDKAGVSYKRFLKEFKFENAADYSVKDEIKADIFEAGDKIDATAISKGKGFQGAIKRLGRSEVLWLTVLSSIVIRVLTVLHLTQAVYSRAKECLDTWVPRRSPFRILKLSE